MKHGLDESPGGAKVERGNDSVLGSTVWGPVTSMRLGLEEPVGVSVVESMKLGLEGSKGLVVVECIS